MQIFTQLAHIHKQLVFSGQNMVVFEMIYQILLAVFA